MVCNCLKRLESGLAVIPDPDPGRNEGKRYFGTFYKTVNIKTLKIYLCSKRAENFYRHQGTEAPRKT
jgi:hypothetical protein